MLLPFLLSPAAPSLVCPSLVASHHIFSFFDLLIPMKRNRGSTWKCDCDGHDHKSSDACRSHRKRQSKNAPTSTATEGTKSEVVDFAACALVLVRLILDDPLYLELLRQEGSKKKIKQTSLFESFKLVSPPPARVIDHLDVTKALLWFSGASCTTPSKRPLTTTTLTALTPTKAPTKSKPVIATTVMVTPK
jgi:hypothetical protein